MLSSFVWRQKQKNNKKRDSKQIARKVHRIHLEQRSVVVVSVGKSDNVLGLLSRVTQSDLLDFYHSADNLWESLDHVYFHPFQTLFLLSSLSATFVRSFALTQSRKKEKKK